MIPKWIEESEKYEEADGRVYDALSIAWEALERMANRGDEDPGDGTTEAMGQDIGKAMAWGVKESNFRTAKQAKDAMSRIEKLGEP